MTPDDRKTPAPAPDKTPAAQSSSSDISSFLSQVKALGTAGSGASGKLIFALDATLSRQPTWDMACSLQADMFKEAGSVGKLAMRLIYYRGFNECRATGWITDTAQLAALMGRIDCVGGHTQIGKVLADARREAERAFREIARLTGGAWCRFDPGSAAQLRELLRAAAAYAAGGHEALKRLSSASQGATLLLGQMR
jgi:hypothetical protein